MAPISPQGSLKAPIYIIVEQPYDQDKDKGYIFSGGYGYIFQKMLQDAGLQNQYYLCARRNDLEHPMAASIIENAANYYKPPIIITLGNATGFYCPETLKKSKKIKNVATQAEQDSDMEKYSGSLLQSTLFNYPHYVIPTLSPGYIAGHWDLRDICVFLDLGKAKSELDYFRKHGVLEPLPVRTLTYDFDQPGGFARLLERLDYYANAKLLSVDIETIYPNKKSSFYPHPGYPVTIGIAADAKEGISFRLFRTDTRETIVLWKKLENLLSKTKFLGQNFFDFDGPRLQALGYPINYNNITDTLIRHHILWPELPHKLQFMTKQYTRQPYYKDEGHGWHIKDLKKLMHYNCLDVCVTYEVWEAQEHEFEQRPHLK